MKILVCTDLSERSNNAIARALMLADGGSVHVLHVVDDTLASEIRKGAVNAAESRIASTLASMTVPDNCTLTSDVLPGHGHRTIVDIATSRKFDLIVFGTHRPYSGAYSSIGSTIEKTVKATFIPVLVVKRPALERYGSAVVAVDFSPPSKKAAMLAPLVAPDASIRYVHAFLDQHANSHMEITDAMSIERDKLVRMLRGDNDHAPPYEIVIERDKPIALIRDQIADKDADLVVMGTDGRSGLARLVLGSVAEDFLAEPPCDVLVARAE
jgi:nucleotide-binding universal stress UspA family protein